MNITELQTQTFDRAILEPVFIGEEKRLDGKHLAVLNVNSGKVASIVSPDYNLVQHEQVIKSVSDALTNLGIKVNAKVFSTGNRLFVDLNFPDARLYMTTKEKGEEFFSGIRVVNSYDKTTGILVLPRLTRVVCSNGMIMDINWVKSFHVAHTNSLAKDFQEIVEVMIKDMVNSNDKLKAMINDCISDSVEWELLTKIIAKLCVGRKNHIEAIKGILQSQRDEGKTITRWDVYNAFTNYATHGQQIKPNVENWLQSKAQTVLTTPLAKLPVPVAVEVA